MSLIYTPRDYQAIGIDLCQREPGVLLAYEPGSGKTVTAYTAADILMNDRFAVQKTLVVCPKLVAQEVWTREAAKWRHLQHLRIRLLDAAIFAYYRKVTASFVGAQGPGEIILGECSLAEREALFLSDVVVTKTELLPRDWRATKDKILKDPAQIHVISRDHLFTLAMILGRDWPYQLMIGDECFPAGTPVRTPLGEVPIETLRPGDIVETGFGPRCVEAVAKKRAETIKLRTENGAEIECTRNHPFFTDEGWVAAENTLGKRVLFSAGVPVLRDFLSAENTSAETRTWKDLLETLQQDLALVRGDPGREAGSGRADSRKKAGSSLLEQGARMDSGGEKTNQGSRDPVEKQTGCPRGERDGDDDLRGSHGDSSGSRLDLELPHKNSERPASGRAPGRPLQAGFRVAGTDAVSGSRRGDTPLPGSAGPKEGEDTRFTRVVSIADHQPGGEKDVWDIQVAGAPFFFAGGFLVHNCTMFKNHESKRTIAVRWLRKEGLLERLILMSGTPSPRGIENLWAQVRLLDLGKRLGATQKEFRERFMLPDQRDGKRIFSWKAKPGARDKVTSLISDICMAVRADVWRETEPPRVVERIVQLPDDARELYNRMEDELHLELGGGVITAAQAAVLTNKLLQIASGAVLDSESTWHVVHDAKLDALEELIEELDGEPLIIMYWFKSTLARLRERFGKKLATTKTKGFLDQFAAGNIPLLALQPGGAGHGLDGLQDGGHHIAAMDMFHDWELFQQTVSRLDRSGQKHRVTVHLLLADKTKDAQVGRVLADRGADQGMVMDALKRR